MERKKKYAKRALRALPLMLTLNLTFFFFSAADLTINNSTFFSFGITDAVLWMGLFSLLMTVLSTSLVALNRKEEKFNRTMAFFLAVTVCVYIQGVFMSGTIGPLDGDSVYWSEFLIPMVIDTAIWAVVFFVTFFLQRKHGKLFKQLVLFLPLLLLFGQLVGFSVSIITAEKGTPESEIGYLSYEDFTDFSEENNTIVFLLDRMDYSYLERVLEKDPDFFDRLDGFTWYDNATAMFGHTRNGANYLLTNYTDTLYKEKPEDFFYHSWDDGTRHILKDLKKAGYTTDLYTEAGSIAGHFNLLTDQMDNLKLGKGQIAPWKLVWRLSSLIAYRYLPTAMRPFIWGYLDRYNDVFSMRDEYDIDETVLDSQIEDFKITDEYGYFKFYHFNGAHNVRLLEDGTQNAIKANLTSQVKGSFSIVFRALDKMKELGIYDNATVIITADHGDFAGDYESMLSEPVRIAMFYKPSGKSGTPLVHSYAPVSQDNVPATILKSAGLDYSDYGTPLDEVDENDHTVERRYWRSVAAKGGLWVDTYVYYYDIGYDSADFSQWKQNGYSRIEYPLSF